MNAETQTPQPHRDVRESLEDTRRLVPALLGIAVVIGGGGYWLLHHHHDAPVSEPLVAPQMKAPAGGANRSKTMDDLAASEDRKSSAAAKKQGQSYTSMLGGQDLPEPVGAPELGDTPKDRTAAHHQATPDAPAPTTPKAPAPTQAPDAAHAPDKDAVAFNADPTPAPRPPKPRPHLSERAEMEMIEAWSGHRPSLERVVTGEASGLDLDGRQAGRPIASAAQEGGARAAVSGQKSSATTATATSARGPLLLAAGRGVYGHSVLTTNSDLGNQVLIEIDSGPLRKARISGTFQMKNDRLIVKFNKLMIGDKDPIAVSAYAVSPETAETGVASDVEEHLATRIILPAAASFVQGLGNAMMSANTTSYTGGYGMTAFTHLNLAQQMGAAAGSMGQEVGQLLQKQTPQQATVYLRQNDEVGVLFDEPVHGS